MVERPPAPDPRGAPQRSTADPAARWPTLLAGAVAAWCALAVGEIGAGLWSGWPSPLESVATAVIDVSPPAVTDWAIGGFGPLSTSVLQVGVVVVIGLVGAGLGRIARRRRGLAAAGVAVLAALLPALALARGEPVAAPAGAAGLVTIAGVAALLALVARAARVEDAAGTPPAREGPADPLGPAVARRRFLSQALVLAAGSALLGGVGRWLSLGGGAEEARAAVELPRPPDPLPAPPAGASLELDGITPLVTPNREFYVVDTTLRSPRVDPADWRLRVTGLVDRPLSLDYDELVDLSTDEADIMLACVSNDVGGGLAGVARWQGIRLDDLLDRAGAQAGAQQIMGHSVEGFSAGFPVEALDGRDAIVAVGMNGDPLPVAHGFPARLVVPGLYGYVSATKWLDEIRLTTWDVDGYWVPRGWAKEGPIKIASRIDRPSRPATVDPGIVTVAGVAWAPMAGVAEVEVRIDDGAWQSARLAEPIGAASWRQWALDWDAPPGDHEITVRAIDADGAVQTAAESGPRPDGATGHHRRSVRVGS